MNCMMSFFCFQTAAAHEMYTEQMFVSYDLPLTATQKMSRGRQSRTTWWIPGHEGHRQSSFCSTDPILQLFSSRSLHGPICMPECQPFHLPYRPDKEGNVRDQKERTVCPSFLRKLFRSTKQICRYISFDITYSPGHTQIQGPSKGSSKTLSLILDDVPSGKSGLVTEERQ